MKLRLEPHQKDAIKHVHNKKFASFVFAGTGTGKTFSSLFLAKSMPKQKFLILVHKLPMIKEWQEEQIKFFGGLLPNVQVKAYTTKLVQTKVDVLIIDELHRLKGMKSTFLNVVRYIETKKLIGLTATAIDELQDLSFYWLMQNAKFLKEIRDTKYMMKSAETKVNKFQDEFREEFAPIYDYQEMSKPDGSSVTVRKISGFRKSNKLKKILKPISLFIKSSDVIEDVEDFTIHDFTPIQVNYDTEKIGELISKEIDRRIEINDFYKIDYDNYLTSTEEIKNYKKNKQIEKDKEEPDVDKIETLSKFQKQQEQIREDSLKVIYPQIQPSSKWITDLINESFDIKSYKLSQIKQHRIIVYFFKESEKYLKENLTNWTSDPYKFIKGGYDYLITHASTIAEGINYIQNITTELLFFDFQQSRLRVEQLIGRINRRGKVGKVKMSYFVDGGIESAMWQSTFNKLTMEEFLK